MTSLIVLPIWRLGRERPALYEKTRLLSPLGIYTEPNPDNELVIDDGQVLLVCPKYVPLPVQKLPQAFPAAIPGRRVPNCRLGNQSPENS